MNQEGNSSQFNWLNIIVLIIFFSLAVTLYNFKRNNHLSPSNSIKFFIQFSQCLLISSSLRTASLLFILSFGNIDDSTPSGWLKTLILFIPGILFIKSYILFAIYFIELYYTNSELQNNQIIYILRFSLIGGYIITAIGGLFSFITKNFIFFKFITDIIKGLLYFLISCIIIYYKRTIISSFHLNQNDSTLFLKISNILCCLFMIQGIFLFAILVGFININTYENIYALLYYLISEIAPTMIFLKFENRILNKDTPRQSETEISILMNESRMSTQYKPPFIS